MTVKSVDEEKVEPRENDKCMANNDTEPNHEGGPPASRLEDLRKRAKHFASNKYNVIIVLLCVFLFIFFIIVISLAVRLGSYQCPKPDQCLTPECLLASATVVARSDMQVDPCSNFWAYSCAGWLQRNPLPPRKGSYSVRDQLQNKILDHIRDLIDLVPHSIEVNSPKWKVKNFYSSCMSESNIEFWLPPKLLQAIHEIGGWSIINTPPIGQWQRNDVLKKLQVTFGVSVFFKVVVEPDDSTPTRNIIKLLPGGLGLPSRRYYFDDLNDPYAKAYEVFIKGIMLEFGVPLSDASRFAEEMFNYERRLASITPEYSDLRKVSESYKVLTVRELSRLSTSISWTDLLQAYFPDLVEPDTQVAILSEKYFSDISKLISTTESTILNNYYMWRFVCTYVPHLSAKFKLVANHFKQTFEGVHNLAFPFEDRWEFCVKLTSQYLGHAVGDMYVDRHFPKESRDKASFYLQKMIGVLSVVVDDIDWLEDGNSISTAQEKVRSAILLTGYPEFYTNHSLNDYYKELKVQSDYYQNIKAGVYFLHKKQEEILKNHVKSDDGWTIFPHDTVAKYQYSGNQLVVPAGIFESPLFDLGAPLAIKYGVLAGHVADKLSQMFDDRGINYEAFGILHSWMSNRSLEEYQKKETCLKHIISKNPQPEIMIDPDLTIGSFMTSIGGIKLAYKAFKRNMKESGSRGDIPSLDVTEDQLFFISYAQSLCEATRPEKLLAYKHAIVDLPAELRVLISLQQLPEFASAFSCPVGSTMNPQNQCNVW